VYTPHSKCQPDALAFLFVGFRAVWCPAALRLRGPTNPCGLLCELTPGGATLVRAYELL